MYITAWSVKNSSVLLTINMKSEKNILTFCIFDEQDIGVKRSNDGQRYNKVTVYMQKHQRMRERPLLYITPQTQQQIISMHTCTSRHKIKGNGTL